MLQLIANERTEQQQDAKMSEIDPEIFIRAQQRLLASNSTPEEKSLLRDLMILLQQQASELDALKRISLNLTSTLDLTAVLHTVAAESLKLVRNASAVHIFLYQNGEISFGTALDTDGKADIPIAMPRPDGLTATTIKTGGTIIVEDMGDHALYQDTPKNWKGSIIGMPLKMGTRVIGEMNLSRTVTGPFSREELRLLQLLADHATIAIINAELHQGVSEQAYTDTLTGLPNRRALDERLDVEVQRARRFNHPFSVVMMDLDGFKSVNDIYGHEVGDRVLQRTFGLVSRNLRATDFLARYGGDELTMILPEANLETATLVTQKLQNSLRRLVIAMPDGTNRTFDISGGMAFFPVHGKSASELLRAADVALYRAKRTARGSFQIAKGVTGELPPLLG